MLTIDQVDYAQNKKAVFVKSVLFIIQ